MNTIMTIFRGCSLPLELLVATLVYIKYLDYKKRKPQVSITIVSLIAVMFILSPVIFSGAAEKIENWNMLALSIVYSIVCYVILVVFIYVIADISIQDILYIANCSYLTQHLIHCANLEIAAFFRVTDNSYIEIACFAIGYVLCYFKVAPALISEKGYKKQSLQELGTTFGVIAVAISLSAVVKELSVENRVLYMSYTAYAMIFCFYALWVEADRKKKAELEEKLLLEQQCFIKYKEQYEMSQENINLINHKCHDLKHQIAALRHIEDKHARDEQIKELEKAVFIYDAMVHTGNEVLDTIMTEKSLYCERNGIVLACVADGQAVAGMNLVDIYTIFGNALDNALECVAKFEDKTKRTISVIVTERANMLLFQFENYYETLSGSGEKGFRSTKEQNGYHGFGLKSIEHTAEKYGGIMNVCTDNHIFLLQVMIPKIQPNRS